ncbi:MAG: hypothetical protein JWP91_173 [Fibrobacteres bacterium]|nr:hypothetical protein [Fibrobacterota bacterium]
MRSDRTRGTAARKRHPYRTATTLLLYLAAILWLTACIGEGPSSPTEPVAGGSGSEAGDAYGRVRSIGSERNEAGAKVLLYRTADSLYGHPSWIASASADSVGGYRIHALPAGTYDLEIRGRAGESVLYRRGLVHSGKADSDFGTDTLSQSARFKGRVPGLADSTILWLAGTPYSARPDSLGAFRFDSLPKGPFVVVSERVSAGVVTHATLMVVTLQPGDSTIYVPPSDTSTQPPIDTVPKPSSYGLLLEDFEDGNATNLFPGIGPGVGAWSSETMGVGATIVPSTENLSGGITSAGAYRGKSMMITYALPLGYGPKDWIRTVMDMSGAPADLGKADTLSLFAKGSGRIHVEIFWKDGTGWLSAWTAMDLSPDWKEYRFPTRNAGITDKGLKTILRVQIGGYNGTGFWMDDIRLRGTGIGAVP